MKTTYLTRTRKLLLLHELFGKTGYKNGHKTSFDTLV